MTTTLEKAARAAFTFGRPNLERAWERLDDRSRSQWFTIADAVLKAIEEPTLEMISAGTNADDDYFEDAKRIYTAMIRAVRNGRSG